MTAHRLTPLLRAKLWLFTLATILTPAIALAQRKRGGGEPALDPSVVTGESFANKPLILMIALGALGFAPFVLMMVTSFVKISVVLSILRRALGTPGVPPSIVITGLSIVLTRRSRSTTEL